MSKGLAQGPFMVARVGFEPATFRMEVAKVTTEPPRPTFCVSRALYSRKKMLIS